MFSLKNIETIHFTREGSIVTSKICNKCGSVHTPDEDNEFTTIHSASVDFEGERNKYRSKCWWFDLCDECLIEIVKTFKHVPDWFHGTLNNQVGFDKWIANGCKNENRYY